MTPSSHQEALLHAISLLSQPDPISDVPPPDLYGESTQETDSSEAAVYSLSNETGTGRITVYPIFSGVELYYNDIHLSYCRQNQGTSKNGMEINHCRVGRYECTFGESNCCYLSAGDLSISSTARKKSSSCFPLRHYHGITILVNFDALPPEIQQVLALLDIDLEHIRQYICAENRCCIMRATPAIEHIFSELYSIRGREKAGYRKVKMLELLLFLSDLDTESELLQTNYLRQNQVRLIKAVAAYITEDITQHHTISSLSERFQISPTALKQYFHGVYGTSIYAYLRMYRLQKAQQLLLDTALSVADIAHQVGYSNPNKFTTAFKDVYGCTPTAFRTSVHLDSSYPSGHCQDENLLLK